MPDDHAQGRSRGGLTTKIHMPCDANGAPLRSLLSGGQASDISSAQAQLDESAIHQGNVANRVNVADQLAFLGLLEADIRNGRHFTTLPEGLAQAMLANANLSVNLDEDIEGDVAF